MMEGRRGIAYRKINFNRSAREDNISDKNVSDMYCEYEPDGCLIIFTPRED